MAAGRSADRFSSRYAAAGRASAAARAQSISLLESIVRLLEGGNLLQVSLQFFELHCPPEAERDRPQAGAAQVCTSRTAGIITRASGVDETAAVPRLCGSYLPAVGSEYYVYTQ